MPKKLSDAARVYLHIQRFPEARPGMAVGRMRTEYRADPDGNIFSVTGYIGANGQFTPSIIQPDLITPRVPRFLSGRNPPEILHFDALTGRLTGAWRQIGRNEFPVTLAKYTSAQIRRWTAMVTGHDAAPTA